MNLPKIITIPTKVQSNNIDKILTITISFIGIGAIYNEKY